MTVRERIVSYIRSKGLTNRGFSLSIGMSENYVASMRRSIQPGVVAKIAARYPDLNTGWLLTGEGQMLRPAAPREEAAPVINPNLVMAPLISKYAYAGYMAGYGDEEYIDTLPTVPFIVPETQTSKGDYIAIEVKGDSMDNNTPESIMEGDMLLCRIIKPELWRDCKLHMRRWNFVIVTREGILVKRIVDHDLGRGTIRIHSLNELYSDETIELRDVIQIMNVVQLMRRPIL